MAAIALFFFCADVYADTSAEWRAWVDACIKRLDSDDFTIRDGATAALVRLGPDVINSLLPHLNSKSPEMANRIREVIYKLGSPAREKLNAIIDKKSAPPDTLMAVNSLLESLKQIDKETILKLINPFDENGNQSYKNPESVAKKIMAVGKTAVPVLIEYWKNGDGNEIYYANEAIQQVLLKLGDAGIAKDLREIVWNNSYAAKPLYKFEGKDSVPLFIEILQNYYTSGNQRSGYYAIYPIIDVIREAKPPEAVKVLSDVICNPECYDREHVTRILAEIGDPACVPALKKALELEKERTSQFGEEYFPYEYYNMNEILCDFGDKDGVSNLINLLENTFFETEDYDWYLSQIVNSIRKTTGKDLTKNLRPYKKNRQAILDAYSKWWEENKDKAEWDKSKKKFSIKE